MQFIVSTAKKGKGKRLYLSFINLKSTKKRRQWSFDSIEALIFSDFDIANHVARQANKSKVFLVDEGGLLFQVSSVGINPDD